MTIKINEPSLSFRGAHVLRKSTNYIILHHSASSTASADDVHHAHLNKGWLGIGYHFYVRKNGEIYHGRPINTVGAHTSGYNSQSIGVCFEGNFEKNKMPAAQLKAGSHLIEYLTGEYPKAKVKSHQDLNATACPGKNFPIDEMLSPTFTETGDIISSLAKRNIITNVVLWLAKCRKGGNAYWLAYKICNMTQNRTGSPGKLESVNDIVWELGERKIISDKQLWLRLLADDINLYHLAKKAANLTENKEGYKCT